MAPSPSPRKCMVRNLRAASYAPTEDNRGVYTLNEEKGRLMRKCWTGDDHLEWDDLVVENVKKGTPAVYLVWDGDQGNDTRRQELVVCIDNKSDTLKALKYDLDEERFIDLSLHSVPNRAVDSKARLSGGFDRDGALVLFQNENNAFKAFVVFRNNFEIHPIESFPAKPRQGSPHQVFGTCEKLHLFYVDEGETIRHISISHDSSYDTNKWDEHELKDAKFDKPVENFVVLAPEDELNFKLYVLCNSELERVDSQGKLPIGRVQGESFIPLTQQQDWLEDLLQLPNKLATGFHCPWWGQVMGGC